MIKELKLFLFALCLFASFEISAAPKYKLVDLGLQESDQSEAVAINDNGQVAGIYWMLGKKYYFMWTEKDGIHLIDLPETASIKVLNNAGQIAGDYKDASGKDRGFIWEASLGFNDIDTLGGSFTRVYDMNDLGQIVGESESSNISLVDGRKEIKAFIWQKSSMIDLGALTGDLGVHGDRSVATSINNQGQIIGTSNFLIAHKQKFLRTKNRAVVWQNGVIEEIDRSLHLECSALATSVNNSGLATFWHSTYGYYAVDLAEKSKILFSINNFNCPFEITDEKDIFIIHTTADIPAIYISFLKGANSKEYKFGEIFYDYVYFQDTFQSPTLWKLNAFVGTSFNNKRWVAGVAENIYGEHHGVLLVPITE